MKLREVAVSGICTAWTGQLILAASMAPGCQPVTPDARQQQPGAGRRPATRSRPQLEHQSLRKGPILAFPRARSASRPAPSTLLARKGAWLLPRFITVGRAMAAVVAG